MPAAYQVHREVTAVGVVVGSDGSSKEPSNLEESSRATVLLPVIIMTFGLRLELSLNFLCWQPSVTKNTGRARKQAALRQYVKPVLCGGRRSHSSLMDLSTNLLG